MDTTSILVISFLFLAALLAAGLVLLKIFKKEHEVLHEDFEVRMYKVKEQFLNSSEFVFFNILRKKLSPDFHLFPKVRIADVLTTLNGHGYYRNRNKILPRHIDFLICDSKMKPIYAIELDGSSHNNSKQQQSDTIKDSVFKHVGLPLKRVAVGEDFEKEIEEIIASLN